MRGVVIEMDVVTAIGDVKDEELLHRLAAGDQSALAALYDRYGRLALWLANQTLGDGAAAEDAVQDAFVSVWRHAAAYDPSRGTVRAWLLATVRHRCIDLRRQGPHIPPIALEPELALSEPDDSVWDHVAPRIEGEAVRRAIVTLPPEQRAAVYLAYYHGLTHAEIASRLQVPLGTVKSRLRLGLEKLRIALVGLERLPVGA